MPRIASAKKALRQSRSRAQRNRAQRSELRTAVKRVTAAPSPQAYAQAIRLLDRAARKGLIHPNNAARHKSQLAKLVEKPGK